MGRPSEVVVSAVLRAGGFTARKCPGVTIWERRVIGVHNWTVSLVLGVEDDGDAAILTAVIPKQGVVKIAEGTVSEVCSTAVAYAQQLK